MNFFKNIAKTVTEIKDDTVENIKKNRIKSSIEKLNLAKDVETIANDGMVVFLDAYKTILKGTTSILPVIENTVKRNPDVVADIVIEGEKVTKSIESIVANLDKVFDDQFKKEVNETAKDLEKSAEVINGDIKVDEAILGRIKTNFESFVGSINGQDDKTATTPAADQEQKAA